jgi:CRISPR-associated protein Csb2
MAIQFLGQETLSTGRLEAPSTLAVLIPTDAIDTDVEVVTEAMSQLWAVSGQGGRLARRQGRLTNHDASRFWPSLPDGCERRWLTVPAAVPDGRPPRRSEWSMADAVALSVGLVWRDVLATPGRGAGWQIELSGEAKRRGVVVEGLRMVTHGDLTRFVHRVNPGVVVRPYRALIDLGTLTSSQALVAIGQSRHLGGGLLRPVDMAPAEDAKP